MEISNVNDNIYEQRNKERKKFKKRVDLAFMVYLIFQTKYGILHDHYKGLAKERQYMYDKDKKHNKTKRPMGHLLT